MRLVKGTVLKKNYISLSVKTESDGSIREDFLFIFLFMTMI